MTEKISNTNQTTPLNNSTDSKRILRGNGRAFILRDLHSNSIVSYNSLLKMKKQTGLKGKFDEIGRESYEGQEYMSKDGRFKATAVSKKSS
jgi:hypothetical protein